MLTEASLEIAICSISAPYRFPFPQIKVYHSGIDENELRRLSFASKLIRYRKYMPVLRKAIQQFKPDRIHALYASSYGGLVWYSGFKPYDVSVWGTDVYHFPKQHIGTKWIIKKVFDQAERITSTSRIMADETAKYTTKEIQVIPYGIPTDVFIPGKCLIQGIEAADLVIGTVKSFEPTYGIELLIDAFIHIRQSHPQLRVKLLLVGDGSLRNMFEQKISAAGCISDVIMTGYIPNREVYLYHQCIDVFVAPTLHESFGVSMLEAMSCAKPIVAADIPSYREIDHQTQTIQFITQRDPTLLAQHILNLLLNPELRTKLGEKSRELICQYYDQQQIHKTITEFYQNI